MKFYERRFIEAEDISTGPLPAKYLTKTWLALTLLLALSLFLVSLTTAQIALYLLLAPVIARLIVLDLCYLVLPDIYTLPLIVLGIALTFIPIPSVSLAQSLLGMLVGGGGILLLAIVLEKVNKQSNIGGGDIKLIAAASTFIGLESVANFLWLACAFSFILYPILRKNRKTISFGPTLALSFWLLLIHPKIIENALILFI
tara:strand:- start:250236 stop:250838 length:603 start_codon:yes stop_codon:yes gene_type:complete